MNLSIVLSSVVLVNGLSFNDPATFLPSLLPPAPSFTNVLIQESFFTSDKLFISARISCFPCKPLTKIKLN